MIGRRFKKKKKLWRERERRKAMRKQKVVHRAYEWIITIVTWAFKSEIWWTEPLTLEFLT